MLTKKQVSILSVFKENLSESLTFKQIKQKSKQKSNSMIQGAVKEFLKQNILSVKQIGDVSVYTIMLTNTSLSYLNLMNESEIEKSKIPMPILEEIKSKLKSLLPERYIGEAVQLTTKAIKEIAQRGMATRDPSGAIVIDLSRYCLSSVFNLLEIDPDRKER